MSGQLKPVEAGYVDRIAPNNLDAERALLGSMLVDVDICDRILSKIRAEHFYATLHETIFTAIADLRVKNVRPDIIGVANELRSRGAIERVGGLAYIRSLMDTVPTVASADYYAEIVAEKAALRALIAAGTEVTRLGYEGEGQLTESLTSALQAVQRVADVSSPTARRPMTMAEASAALREELNAGAVFAYPTSIASLTRNIGGWRPGTLNVIAGSPAMGKSCYAATEALSLALHYGTVAFFPLEIGRRDQTLRFEQMRSGVSALTRVQGKPLTAREKRLVNDAAEWLAGIPIKLFDKGFSSNEVVVECRRIASEMPLTGIFVDHVGFLRDVEHGSGRESKHERLDRAVARLLDAAEALNVPLFVVQHVNRNARDSKPALFDLRDGGNIEGHAHNVIFTYREHWDQCDGRQTEGTLIIAKARSGRAGEIETHFDDEHVLWTGVGDERNSELYDEKPADVREMLGLSFGEYA